VDESDQKRIDSAGGFGWTCAALLTPRDARYLRRFSIWNIGLALAFAGSILELTSGVVSGGAGYVLALVTLVLGIGAIRSYIRFLRHADELLRKIHLEAIAMAFGSGIVLIFTWELLELLGAPELQVSLFAAAMLFFWGIGQAVGVRRYSEGSR